jgi:hypothetical protein
MALTRVLSHLHLDTFRQIEGLQIAGRLASLRLRIPRRNEQDGVQRRRDHPVGHQIGLGSDLPKVVDAAGR